MSEKSNNTLSQASAVYCVYIPMPHAVDYLLSWLSKARNKSRKMPPRSVPPATKYSTSSDTPFSRVLQLKKVTPVIKHNLINPS